MKTALEFCDVLSNFCHLLLCYSAPVLTPKHSGSRMALYALIEHRWDIRLSRRWKCRVLSFEPWRRPVMKVLSSTGYNEPIRTTLKYTQQLLMQTVTTKFSRNPSCVGLKMMRPPYHNAADSPTHHGCPGWPVHVAGVEAQVQDCPGTSPDEHDQGAHNEDTEQAVENVQWRLLGALHSKEKQELTGCVLHRLLKKLFVDRMVKKSPDLM